METQTQPADFQATLTSILASIQKVQEDANKQNKTLQDENKQIIDAVHDQANKMVQDKNIVYKDLVDYFRCLLYTSRCV